MFTLISSTNSEGKRLRPMSNGSSASPCTSFFNTHALTYLGCFAPEVPILGTSNWNDTKLSNQIGAVSVFLSSFLSSFHFISFLFPLCLTGAEVEQEGENWESTPGLPLIVVCFQYGEMHDQG